MLVLLLDLALAELVLSSDNHLFVASGCAATFARILDGLHGKDIVEAPLPETTLVLQLAAFEALGKRMKLVSANISS